MNLSILRLERLVARRAHREALELLLQMLEMLDRDRGGLNAFALDEIASDGSLEDLSLVFCTRLAAAIGELLTDPALVLEPLPYEYLLRQHRWIETIFALSGFRSSDPFVARLANDVGPSGSSTFPAEALPRLLALLSSYSPLAADIDALAAPNPSVATLAFLHYVGARAVLRSASAELRERLLAWLPEKLDALRLGFSTLLSLPEPYMHCSYAFGADKHAIKGPLIAAMRSACLDAGAVEWRPGTPSAVTADGKPTIVVVAEHLRDGHSVHRTHSRAIAALKTRFHVVGLYREGLVDAVGAALFDETIVMAENDTFPAIVAASRAVVEKAPSVVFHIGVGMATGTIGLASLRLAPVQCVSYGHTATTMSPAIDYMLLPEDFVRDDTAHSETLVKLPREAFPYAPVPVAATPRQVRADGVVRVAVAASLPKINPGLLQTLQQIEQAATRPVEFHFLTLGAVGIAFADLVRVVRHRLRSAVVHLETDHDTYVQRLAACDFFLSPFPYGNMNGLIDAFQLGLPGVCLDGAEAHAHADGAFFRRIGLPEALIAHSTDGYTATALRLIDEPAWLEECRSIVAAADLDAAFVQGDATLFADAVAGLAAQKK